MTQGDFECVFSLNESCTIYRAISSSSRITQKKRSNPQIATTKATKFKTSHSFSPRRIIKHKLLQNLLELFIVNSCDANVLILHPYTGHFVNNRKSKTCDGSSKVIIDSILNIRHKASKKSLDIHIDVAFIEIFQNQLFDDMVNYLKRSQKQIDNIELNIYVFHSSVEEFFGLNKNNKSNNSYHKLMKNGEYQRVFWFIDPYNMETLLSPKDLNLFRIISNRGDAIHFVYFLLFLKDLKHKKHAFVTASNGMNGLFALRDKYLKIYSDIYDAASIRIINNGTPNYDLVYLFDKRFACLSHPDSILKTFIKYNCHQFDKNYLCNNAFSEKYFQSHWKSRCALDTKVDIMSAICDAIHQRLIQMEEGDNALLIQTEHFIRICKYVWHFCE